MGSSRKSPAACGGSRTRWPATGSPSPFSSRRTRRRSTRSTFHPASCIRSASGPRPATNACSRCFGHRVSTWSMDTPSSRRRKPAQLMRSLRQAVSIGTATPPPSCCGERGSDWGSSSGRPLVELRCRTVFEDDEPTPGDLESDGADLLNAWHVGHADWKFPRPDLFTDDGGDAFRPKLVAVGDSFWWVADVDHRRAPDGVAIRLLLLLQRPRTAGRTAGTGPSPRSPVGSIQGMSWEYVFSADAIIVEANEGALGVAGWGFVEAAERELGGGNFPAAASATPWTRLARPARSRPGAGITLLIPCGPTGQGDAGGPDYDYERRRHESIAGSG